MTEKEFEQVNLNYRSKTDYILDKTKPIILMLDGRAFSKFTKEFDTPFDVNFVGLMDKTAKYLCANIQNAVYAFVQSDEISIYIKPCEELTEPWFGGRLNKICSVAAGMASSFFMKEYISYKLTLDDSEFTKSMNILEIEEEIKNLPIPSFDCRAWNVPTYDEVIDWFVYRQKDCIRNSKQQFSQKYVPHKALLNKNTDEQIQYVLEATWGSMDWNKLENAVKYGRLIRKIKEVMKNISSDQIYFRNVWKTIDISTNIQYLI